MCRDIYHNYQQCQHHKFIRTESCWQDRWEAFCPCLSFPGVFPYKGAHRSTEDRYVRPGMCSNCEESRKKRTRRDYEGFTAQQTHGPGSSHGTRQVQAPQSTGVHQEVRAPDRAHQYGAYKEQLRMNMAPQPASHRCFTSPPGVRARNFSPSPGQGASQPRRQRDDPYAGFPKRERAVRGRKIGYKVVMDKSAPAPHQRLFEVADPSKSSSARDLIDRSDTVSPLTEDDRNAPHVDIPAHDEYAHWV
ncbi:uncharacterized protein BKA55DRAFT_497980 [Fusarium redolens]|uniref:Uncharacterized protein n=1 Tax=Fusarium redolens TaxID=48865 RepID=A0A9P9KX44_FUSRE|nr:uncharacterized protein BKA55DRAFT_497980 [Fusarium redolens]KAH7270042.1 hypothetical protein BKA55DRAFT_497980 [Fusarium redolens]